MTIQILAMTSLNIGAQDALNEYLSVVGPLMESVGAKLTNRYEFSESVVGINEFQFATLVEYPDQDAVTAVFGSKEYAALDQVKKVAFSKYQVSVVASVS